MKKYLILLSSLFLLGACAEIELASHVVKSTSPEKTIGRYKVGKPYKIAGRTYYPKERFQHTETGVASWYGPNFHGKMTANGEIFDMHELTAAHRTLQMPSIVRVTNLDNGRALVVRINDRGPYSRGRIIDLSKKAAHQLGFIKQGTARVRVDLLEEESRKVAEAAKQGLDTSGYEVAVNKNLNRVQDLQYKPTGLKTNTSIDLAGNKKQAPVRWNPIPDVQAQPLPDIQPQSLTQLEPAANDAKIFVQTGSFSKHDNALNFAQKLQSLTDNQVRVTKINLHDKDYYRVQIPTQTVAEADVVMDKLNAAGYSQTLLVTE